MFKQTFIMLAAALLLFVAGGCQSVTTTHIVGEPSDELAKSFEGVWKYDDVVYHVKAGEKGQLLFVQPEWKEDRWQIKQEMATVTQLHGHTLLYAAVAKDGDEAQQANSDEVRYVILTIISDPNNKNNAFMYMADAEFFAKAIAQGSLKGNVDEKNSDGKAREVSLTSTAKELEAFLTEENLKSAFALNQPLLFTRMSK